MGIYQRAHPLRHAGLALLLVGTLLAPHSSPLGGVQADSAVPTSSQRLASAASDTVLLSDMGPAKDPLYSALSPAVAYNATDDEYLVVWVAENNQGALAPGELEVYGQRVLPSGSTVGDRFRISFMGSDGDPSAEARDPAVAYNSTNNQYLIIWGGSLGGANAELEIYGQRLDATTGALVGSRIRISDMGPDGDPAFGAFHPALAYNGSANEYLVVWHGDDLVDEAVEIYTQRLDAASGAEVGANDLAVSAMGLAADDITCRGQHAAVVYNSTHNAYLVVWEGTDDRAPLGVGETEIFGQQLDAAATLVGTSPLRLSDMGPDGDISWAALRPDVAYDPLQDQYLVVWAGDDPGNYGDGPLADEELEIYAQRLAGADGSEIGPNDVRISTMGPDGDPVYKAFHPRAASRPDGTWSVVWRGDDQRAFDGAPLANEEFEIFAQQLSSTGDQIGEDDRRVSAMGATDGDPTFWADRPALAVGKNCLRPQMIVWHGTDDDAALAPTEIEIFGRALRDSDEPMWQLTVTAGPAVFCPGWTLYYEADITNSTQCTLHDMTITAHWEADACCPEDGPDSAAPGVIDAAGRTMTWNIASLAAGASARVRLRLHALSTLQTGEGVSVTFGSTAREDSTNQEYSVTLTADRARCAPTATPTLELTPSATPGEVGPPTETPTLMPLRGWAALPVIVK